MDSKLPALKTLRTAEHLNERKENLTAAVCHDLRGQLNTILGWIKLARGSIGGVTPEEALVRVEEQVQIQVKLINDILDLSKSTNAEFQVEHAPVDLNEVVTGVLSAIRPLSDAKKIVTAFQFEDSPAVVIGDRSQLRRVVSNLLSNAIKFTPENGKVSVAIESFQNLIQLSVSDTGCGFSADFQARIFDRFARETQAEGQKQTGLGLGLPIVRRLVELHGGVVKAESEGRGKGARFTIILPRALAKESFGLSVQEPSLGPAV